MAQSPNPLAPDSKASGMAPEHPFMDHAKAWKHANSMDPDQLAQSTAVASYATPILGKLAGNPKTSRKDVIRAAADAAGAGHIQPSQAIDLISQMPDDASKLRPWLQKMYGDHLTALVHMKAAALPDPQQAAPAPAQAQPGLPPQFAAQGMPPQ